MIKAILTPGTITVLVILLILIITVTVRLIKTKGRAVTSCGGDCKACGAACDKRAENGEKSTFPDDETRE